MFCSPLSAKSDYNFITFHIYLRGFTGNLWSRLKKQAGGCPTKTKRIRNGTEEEERPRSEREEETEKERRRKEET